MKKVVEYLVLTVVVLLMAAAVFTYVGPHFGWQVDAVLSGSMEPRLKVGSLVVTRSVEPETIAVGDIITFRSSAGSDEMITHRVANVGHSSPIYFETRGDANDATDPFTVPASNLVGKVCCHLPYWGYVTEFLKTPFGFLLAVVIPGTVMIAICIVKMLRMLTGHGREKAIEVVEEE